MKLELTQKNIEALALENLEPCVSIYMPLSKTIRGKANDKVRLENLLKDGARKIIAGGADKSFARKFVEPGFALAQDHFFWKNDAKGLAVFIAAPDIVRYFCLPQEVKESVYVGKGFDIARLRKSLESRPNFFVLAASKNKLALYRALNGKIEKLDIRGLPKGIKGLLPDKTFEKNLQSHGRAPRGKMVIMHGQGTGKETEKTMILKYFQTADRALRKMLANKTDPLVFAGTESLFTAFRQANTYPHLATASLKGNFDNDLPGELFDKAAAVMRFES